MLDTTDDWLGLREARRDARAGKLKAVVVSPNIDDSVSAGGLNDKVAEIMGICVERKVPVIFALSRRRMARAVGKSQRISVVGIINADGANDDFKAALILVCCCWPCLPPSLLPACRCCLCFV